MTPDSDIVRIVSIIAAALVSICVPWIAYYMRKLEKNTNSIKDALVAATKKASHAEGKAEGRKEAEDEAKSKL